MTRAKSADIIEIKKGVLKMAKDVSNMTEEEFIKWAREDEEFHGTIVNPEAETRLNAIKELTAELCGYEPEYKMEVCDGNDSPLCSVVLSVGSRFPSVRFCGEETMLLGRIMENVDSWYVRVASREDDDGDTIDGLMFGFIVEDYWIEEAGQKETETNGTM